MISDLGMMIFLIYEMYHPSQEGIHHYFNSLFDLRFFQLQIGDSSNIKRISGDYSNNNILQKIYFFKTLFPITHCKHLSFLQ